MGLRDRLKNLVGNQEQVGQAKLKARREAEEPVIEDKINELIKKDIFEALDETGATDKIDNYVILGELRKPEETSKEIFERLEVAKGKKGIKESIQDWQRYNVQKKVVTAIRENRTPNYWSLENDNYQNARILVGAEDAVNKAFEKYEKKLDKYFTPEEKAEFYFKCKDQEKTLDEVRQGDLNIGKIIKIREFEDRFGPKYSNVYALNHIEEEAKVRLKLEERELNKGKTEETVTGKEGKLVGRIRRELSTERQQKIQGNENYQGYHDLDNNVFKNIDLNMRERKWLEQRRAAIHEGLAPFYEKTPELKAKIDEMFDDFVRDAQRANLIRFQGLEIGREQAELFIEQGSGSEEIGLARFERGVEEMRQEAEERRAATKESNLAAQVWHSGGSTRTTGTVKGGGGREF